MYVCMYVFDDSIVVQGKMLFHSVETKEQEELFMTKELAYTKPLVSYTYIYIHINTYTYIYIHTYDCTLYLCKLKCVTKYICVYVCMQVWMYAACMYCMYVCMHVLYVCMYVFKLWLYVYHVCMYSKCMHYHAPIRFVACGPCSADSPPSTDIPRTATRTATRTPSTTTRPTSPSAWSTSVRRESTTGTYGSHSRENTMTYVLTYLLTRMHTVL